MTTASTREVGSADAWPEFTKCMSEQLNAGACLLVAAEPALAASVCDCVDAVLERLRDAGSPPSEMAALLLHAPRARFTTAENVARVQRCSAVYGRVPMLMVLQVAEDRSFVMDLPAATGEAAVDRFLRAVADGTAVPALRSAAPPANDRFEPQHGVALRNGLAAVTCTMERLKRSAPGGAVCVFWSERCYMCPSMMMMMDKVVGAVWDAAERHGVAKPFAYIVCNIDDNELPAEDWPGEACRQVVPAVVAYTAEGVRVVYKGRRLPSRLAAFLCDHCLPKGADSVARITEAAVASAAELQEDEPASGVSSAAADNDTSPSHEGASEEAETASPKETGAQDEADEKAARKRECCNDPEHVPTKRVKQ